MYLKINAYIAHLSKTKAKLTNKSVLLNGAQNKKKLMTEKTKYELEYLIRSSPRVLFNCLSTPSGLTQWFANDVNIKNGVFTFFWDGSEEKAKLLNKKALEFIRFKWQEDEDEESYLEFRIKADPITKELALLITDFAVEDEMDEAKRLWDAQVSNLKHILGA